MPTRTHYEVKTQRRSRSDDKENILTNEVSHKKKSRSKKDKKEKIKKSKNEERKVKKSSKKGQDNLILDLEEGVEDATKTDNIPVATNHINGISEDKNSEKVTYIQYTIVMFIVCLSQESILSPGNYQNFSSMIHLRRFR